MISGACILTKREVFESVGGFSESYFMYGEDLDLCFKIKQVGFRRYYVPETSIIHHGGGSTQQSVSNFSTVMMRESVFRFLSTNRGVASAILYRAAMVATSFVRMLLIIPLLAVSDNQVVRHGRGFAAEMEGDIALELRPRGSCSPLSLTTPLLANRIEVDRAVLEAIHKALAQLSPCVHASVGVACGPARLITSRSTISTCLLFVYIISPNHFSHWLCA